MSSNDQKLIASKMHTGASILASNLWCLSVLRNKVAYITRLYDTKLEPPVSIGGSLLSNNSHISGKSLFCYIIIFNSKVAK